MQTIYIILGIVTLIFVASKILNWRVRKARLKRYREYMTSFEGIRRGMVYLLTNKTTDDKTIARMVNERRGFSLINVEKQLEFVNGEMEWFNKETFDMRFAIVGLQRAVPVMPAMATAAPTA